MTDTRKRTRFNPKRKVREGCDPERLAQLAKTVGYGGNPEHKKDPGDFALTPPAQPRSDSTLCDTAGIFRRRQALALLRKGASKGLISERMSGAYPQNIWSVTDDGWPLEAQLENQEQGIYHGYPMPTTDPFRNEILTRWKVS